MKNCAVLRVLCAAAGMSLMAGCSGYAPYPYGMSPRYYQAPQSYVSSYVEASPDEAGAVAWQHPVGYVSSYVRAYHDSDKADLNALQTSALYDLWQKADAGAPTVLRDPTLRDWLNAALAESESPAMFQQNGVRYVFRPNGPLYEARATGERCRDGVLIRNIGYDTQGMRGLFCQASGMRDWRLVR